MTLKVIKFTPYLSELIKQGIKTTTFRLFDDKDLSTDDEFIMATRDSDLVKEFGKAKILSITKRTIETLRIDDYIGHEPVDDALEHYKKYYGDKVKPGSIVKVIRFKVIEFYN